MRRSPFGYALVAAALSLAPNIASAQLCTAMPATVPNYIDCAGSFGGNLNGSAAELAQLTTEFGGTFTYLGKSDDGVGNGPFVNNPGESTSFSLTFDNPITGLFVIGLKASNNYSFYEFDGGAGAGITSITGFSTIGTATNSGNGNVQALSHAALYTRAGTSTVPEPSTYLLMASGLAGLGLVARRRRLS